MSAESKEFFEFMEQLHDVLSSPKFDISIVAIATVTTLFEILKKEGYAVEDCEETICALAKAIRNPEGFINKSKNS